MSWSFFWRIVWHRGLTCSELDNQSQAQPLRVSCQKKVFTKPVPKEKVRGVFAVKGIASGPEGACILWWNVREDSHVSIEGIAG